jgi:hypothetical protein
MARPALMPGAVSSWRIGLVVCVLAASGCGHPPRAVDLNGVEVDPLAGDATATVLAFVTSECPISNQYMPELARIAQQLASQRVRFWLVYPNRSDSVAKIRAHVADFAGSMRALRDPVQALVRRAGVTVTPEVAVYRANGELAYAGRIDDRYAALGLARSAPRAHDLEDALRAVLAGGKPRPAAAAAVGCHISE